MKSNSITFLLLLAGTMSLSGCANSSFTANQINNQVASMPSQSKTITTNKKIVIAHRGASGYLPEHSLASKAMAHAMNVDYIEQDVVMTKDNQLVVLHDPYLDRVTNVAQLFPHRSRQVFGSKRWLAIDFTLAEIKQLEMTEGFSIDPNTGKKVPNYANRFPLFKSSFKVPTLGEEIELIQGLNHSRNMNIGLYVEIKAPWFHLMEKKDISLAVLKVLKDYGYSKKSDKVFVQCFDPDETKRIHDKLLPKLDMDLQLVQLIAETSWGETMRMKDGKLVPYQYDWMKEVGAMEKIKKFADGIGPWVPMIIDNESSKDNIMLTGLVEQAHRNQLVVHPFTLRMEKSQIPHYAKDFEDLVTIVLYKANADGIFTDFPDHAIKSITNYHHQD
jgi:glycerophosphoryl diester phosphodiesterase